MREWGIHIKEMDLIDEAALSKEQMRVVVSLLYAYALDINLLSFFKRTDYFDLFCSLFDGNPGELPHPGVCLAEMFYLMV